MGRHILRLAIVLLAWSCVPATGAEPPPRAFRDVPQTHWAYDAVQQLAQRGYFTGYPDGTFAGKKALVRYEFAVAIQRILQDTQRHINAGGVDVRDVVLLQKLVQEFSDEFTMLGADVPLVVRNLEALRRPWRFEPPDLALAATAAYPGVGVPSDPGYGVGQTRAAAEWARGDVSFYVTANARQQRASRSTGIPYRVMGSERDEPYTLAVIAGHNAEIRARLASSRIPRVVTGPTPSGGLRLADGEPGKARPRMRVSLDQPEACSRDGRVLLRLEENGRRRETTLRITLADRTVLISVMLADRSQEVEAMLDDRDADLLRVTSPEPLAGADQVRLRVISLVTGRSVRELVTDPSTAFE